ncbi:hypothetical protein VPH35_059004 [Triticum aestivum]
MGCYVTWLVRIRCTRGRGKQPNQPSASSPTLVVARRTPPKPSLARRNLGRPRRPGADARGRSSSGPRRNPLPRPPPPSAPPPFVVATTAVRAAALCRRHHRRPRRIHHHRPNFSRPLPGIRPRNKSIAKDLKACRPARRTHPEAHVLHRSIGSLAASHRPFSSWLALDARFCNSSPAVWKCIFTWGASC